MMTSNRHIVVTLLLMYMVTPIHPKVRPLYAESIIRIIGDKASETPAVPVQVPPQPHSTGNTTIRIIGDKPAPVTIIRDEPLQKPDLQQSEVLSPAPATSVKAERPEPASVDKEAVSQPAQQAEKDTAADELKAATEKAEKAEQAHQAELKAIQETAAAERAELAHQAELKAIQESTAAEMALQAAIALEQKLLAERKAEQLRKDTERAEQERNEALKKADEERLSAARRALQRKLETETTGESPRKNASSGSEAETASVTRVVQEKLAEDSTLKAPASIWELYLAAKNNDPALGRSEARVTGSKADSDLVFSALMPRLDSRAGVNQVSQILSNYNTTSDVSNKYTAFNYGITARLTLLNVPTLFSLSAAAAALKGEEAGVAAARQNLIVKCTDSYFTLLKAQTDKQIALGEINRLKQVFEQAQAFLKAGTGDIIAVYEAQSRLDGANADLSKSESNLRLAEQKLSSLTGKAVSAVVNYLPRQPAAPDPDNLDWWVATMEKEQPQIRQAREGLAQTAEQRKSVKSEYLPVLQASGGYDVNRGTAALPNAEVRQWFAGVSLTLPLYSGGETSAKVRRATATEEERRHMLDESMDQFRENVKQAFFNLRYNISLIKALDQKQASTEIQLAAVKKGRKIGTRNAIDVLNAEQAYSMALRDHRHAQYDNIIKVIQLKSAAGILSEADLSELSQFEAPNPDDGLNMIISKVASN